MNQSACRSAPIDIFLAERSGGIAAQLSEWQLSEAENIRISCFKTARQLLRRMEYSRPDLLLLETALPGFDGLTAMRSLDGKATPVILLCPDTNEGAAMTVNGLLAGASDYLVVKKRAAGLRMTAGRNRFWAKVRRALNIEFQEKPPQIELDPWQRPEVLDQSGAGEIPQWLRLETSDNRLQICGSVSQPFPEDGDWIGLAIAASSSVDRMIEVLVDIPHRPAGGIMILPQMGARFARATGEEIARLCNRPVLEYRSGESMMTGQWRLVPGRMVVSPRYQSPGNLSWRLEANRFVDEKRSAALQIDLLKTAAAGTLRLYLFDLPDQSLVEPLRNLIANDQIVLLHAGALAGYNSAWSSDEREASGVSMGPWSREPVSGR